MISDYIGMGVRGVSGGWNNVLMLESNKYSISQTHPHPISHSEIDPDNTFPQVLGFHVLDYDP
jgi:hypothetical protein